jgi:hypothetical protein
MKAALLVLQVMINYLLLMLLMTMELAVVASQSTIIERLLPIRMYSIVNNFLILHKLRFSSSIYLILQREACFLQLQLFEI